MHGEPTRVSGDRDIHTWAAAFQCDECRVLSIGTASLVRTLNPREAATQMREYGQYIEWLPTKAVGQHFADVPDHIAEAASEAHRCHSIGAHRAAVLMARSVLEATAKERGILKGNLIEKIDKLHEEQHIRPLVRDSAHEIRHLGNDMAHGDFVAPVAEEEAAEILELMGELLNEVYQAPAKLRAAQAARLARTGADASNN
ncbi:protein of unknown function [Saccharopolyspora antimicrobica]|uniref:Uncharacterized protein DUF4145 n=2 Tax=Saccharopolyspora antimicrobica TaxID=455193 RepID=A0A1I5KMG6_9PSEU|nr:uncharacterized protein DUF4145 [Saccharopolyspora antimicrobica]SFO86215.1 protein of unknown function [Saccharopolyspora antimicrobica]